MWLRHDKIRLERVIHAFGSTFAFLPTHKANEKNAKELPSQLTTDRNDKTINVKKKTAYNKGLVQWRVTDFY